MTVGGALYVVPSGPLSASTSLELAVVYRHVHDANGYYAALGIRVDATRREIREAYQRLNGQESPRLTYIVKQLLDPEIRRRYDATPLGTFFHDYEIETWIRNALVREVSRLRQQGRVSEAEEIEAASSGELLDTPESGEHDDASPVQPVWGWGYFLRDSLCKDRQVLSQWQQLLVSALGRRGEHVQLAVGFSTGMASGWGVERIGHQILVLLDEGVRPTEALAEAAVSRMVNPQSVPVGHEHGEKNMSGTTNFRRGAEAAKEASKGANFARTQFFSLDDGKSEILRFLTDKDDWIVVDQHQMIPTKKQPADYPKDAKWPEKMGAVCRKDPAFSYGECYIDDFLVGTGEGKAKVKKPGARSWALACLREEVMEDGKVVGLRDKTREVTIPEKDGQPEKTVTEKAIVVVNMGYKNFFAILEGFAGRYGTVLDRDYWIKRSGSDTDTTYQIVPMDPIETGDGRFDLREPQFMQRYQSDLVLEEVVSERADDHFYARFFDPRFTVIEDGKVVPVDSAEAKKAAEKQPEAPSGDVDEARLSALASRVKGYTGGDGAAAETAPAAPETAEQAPAEQEVTREAAPASGGMRDFG